MLRTMATLLVVAAAAASSSTAKLPNIIQIVADDLGMDDLGAAGQLGNGGLTRTPAINKLIETGVALDHYYTFKVCAPTRTSLMTGRYPYMTGYYDMDNDGNHCVASNMTMVPAHLKKLGYATHAIGKWDVGYIKKECTPTYRGFDTFLGYYKACVQDYWYMWESSVKGKTNARANKTCDWRRTSDGAPVTDFSFDNGTSLGGAPPRYNATYNQDVFTGRATQLISEHDQAAGPLYIYLAYQSIHLGCGGAAYNGTGKPYGVQAPCSTMRSVGMGMVNDTYKVQSAMITELDYGVGNVTAALKKNGMWQNTFLVLVSDNGGQLDHCTNAPLRGGKHTFWEGGVRVVSFANGGVLTQAARGTKFRGILHSSDWLRTFVEGAAKGPKIPDADTDGFDAYDAILNAQNQKSPRNEVVHQVQNQYFDKQISAIRIGDYKLMLGSAEGIGDDRTLAFPKPHSGGGSVPPFGVASELNPRPGYQEAGTDNCRSPSGHTQKGTVSCHPYCVWNLIEDVSEQHDLANSTEPKVVAAIKQLLARLQVAADAGPPSALAYAYSDTVYAGKLEQQCEQSKRLGVLQPLLEN